MLGASTSRFANAYALAFPRIVFAGTDYVVLWQRQNEVARQYETMVARVAETGVVAAAPQPFTPRPGVTYSAPFAVAGSPGQVLVAYSRTGDDPAVDGALQHYALLLPGDRVAAAVDGGRKRHHQPRRRRARRRRRRRRCRPHTGRARTRSTPRAATTGSCGRTGRRWRRGRCRPGSACRCRRSAAAGCRARRPGPRRRRSSGTRPNGPDRRRRPAC